MSTFLVASITTAVLTDDSDTAAPIFRECFLKLGEKKDLANWNRAYEKARYNLVYKTVMCENEQFVRCGVCSYEFDLAKNKALCQCRFAHSADDRRKPPTPDDIDAAAHSILKRSYNL